MLALHLDNFLFLLFVAIAIFFQILTKAASKAQRRSGQSRPGSTPAPQSSRPIPQQSEDEEQIRKFLEALGQPTTSKPPPPVAPRTDVPPRPVAPIQPPREMATRMWPSAKPESLRRIQMPGQIPATREARTFRPRVAEPGAFEVHDVSAPLQAPPSVTTPAEGYATATRPAVVTSAPKLQIATLLRSTSDLREAIVLREIFGPPRSFQPLDLVEMF
jgi:hypothetical protein